MNSIRVLANTTEFSAVSVRETERSGQNRCLTECPYTVREKTDDLVQDSRPHQAFTSRVAFNGSA